MPAPSRRPRSLSALKTFIAVAGWGCSAAGVAGATAEIFSTEALKRLSLEELTNLEVTSVSKRPEKLLQAPSAIQVLTGEDLRRSGAINLPEALRLAANLHVAQVDARQWAITARGFNNILANKMLVLIDGRAVYTPLFAGVHWDVQNTLLENIDRIEVISGPGATQWGSNAVNGVINVITKNARDTHGALLTVGGGTEQRGFGAGRYGTEIAPGVHARLYGQYFDRDRTAFPDGSDAFDPWHMAQGGFRLDADRDERDHFTLQGEVYEGAIGQAGAADIEVSGGHLLGRWSRILAQRSELQLQAYIDRTLRDIPGSVAQDLNAYDLDAQHRFAFGDRHEVVWGASYHWVDDDISNPPTLAFIPAQVRRKWYGGFVQDEIALVRKRLFFMLGAKVEHNDYTGWEWQPSLRLAWRPDPARTVWSAVSRAVRTPSRVDVELFVPGSPPFSMLQGGAGFVSENLLAYELGYRLQHGNLWSLSLAGFYHDYDDLRSVEPVNPPDPQPFVLANGLRGASYGAELAAEYHAHQRWRLHLGYTQLHSEGEPKPGSLDRTGTGSAALDPRRQALLRSSHDLPAGVELDLTLRYVGAIDAQAVPAYTELDLRVGWSPAPGWMLAVVGRNLLHDQYAEFGPAASRREIERAVYGKLLWTF